MLTCEYCRALLPNSAKFCGECGYIVDNSTNLPTASNLLTASNEHSSNQITIVDNDIETGLSDTEHELLDPSQTPPLLYTYNAHELTIPSHDETFCTLTPLPSPSHKYPSFSDTEDQSDLDGPYPLPGFGRDIYQQLAQDVADFLDSMNPQPNSGHSIQQKPSPEHGFRPLPGFEHSQGQPNPEHIFRQQPSLDHDFRPLPAFEHDIQQQSSPEDGFLQQPSLDHAFHPLPGFEHDIDPQVAKAHGLYRWRLAPRRKRTKNGRHTLLASGAVIMAALVAFTAMTLLDAYSHPSIPSKPSLIVKKNAVPAIPTYTPTSKSPISISISTPVPALISIPTPTPTPAPTPTPTPVPTPTHTSVPTPTPAPTPTPVPTPTPTPVPTPTPTPVPTPTPTPVPTPTPTPVPTPTPTPVPTPTPTPVPTPTPTPVPTPVPTPTVIPTPTPTPAPTPAPKSASNPISRR